jgi:hypothetical protein
MANLVFLTNTPMEPLLHNKPVGFTYGDAKPTEKMGKLEALAMHLCGVYIEEGRDPKEALADFWTQLGFPSKPEDF